MVKKFNLILIITYLFNIFQSYLLADERNEAIVIMNASSKHFCNCIFISEMHIDFCNESYQRVIGATLNEDNEISLISNFDLKIDETKHYVEISSEFYSSVSYFSNEKGCYFKN